MIEAYMNATLDVLRLAGQMFLQRIDYELRRFAEDLHDFIYDLDRHPRRDWRERFDAFLADQSARGREITPESRGHLIEYLELWERNVFGGPPREVPKSSAFPGGILNPLNWPRAIYTGDSNSSDADYEAAMKAMGDYYLANAGRTHQQLQIIGNLEPTYLSAVVEGILTAAEGEELHALVMENQSDTLGAIQTATEVLGQLRDAKDLATALKDTRGLARFADEGPDAVSFPDSRSFGRQPLEQPRDSLGRFTHKRGDEVSRVRSANPTVTWVDEAASMSDEARLYNSGATGARSNVATRQSQAPSIPRREGGPVRFDGEELGLLTDRKLAVVTSPKAQSQALRQSAALRENGLRGMWEVPNATQAGRARAMFGKLGIDNIDVRIVPR